MKIISISGAPRSGKDTCADILIDQLKDAGVVAKKFAFAKPLYEEVCDAFNVDMELLTSNSTKDVRSPLLRIDRCSDTVFQRIASRVVPKLRGQLRVASSDAEPLELSPREALRVWGYEYKRNPVFGGSADYFTEKAKKILLREPDLIWVCCDTRYHTERDLMRRLDPQALFFRVFSDAIEEDESFIIANGHQSEIEWRLWEYDGTILNTRGDLEAYKEEVRSRLTDRTLSPSFQNKKIMVGVSL